MRITFLRGSAEGVDRVAFFEVLGVREGRRDGGGGGRGVTVGAAHRELMREEVELMGHEVETLHPAVQGQT